MDGAARTLEEAWASMRWRVERGRFALVGSVAAPSGALLAALEEPWQLVREGSETTVLVSERALPAVEASLGGELRVERDLLWVRFEAPMDWEVVGFLARVTTALAREGVPLGAVCGYSRDHLFVAARHGERTRAVLGELFGPESSSS